MSQLYDGHWSADCDAASALHDCYSGHLQGGMLTSAVLQSYVCKVQLQHQRSKQLRMTKAVISYLRKGQILQIDIADTCTVLTIRLCAHC